MHNGDLGGFNLIRRKIIEQLSDESFSLIRGTTDSEHFFALLIDFLNELSDLNCKTLAECLEKTIQKIIVLTNEFAKDKFNYLNMVLTDGNSAVACRFTTDKKQNADSLYLNYGRKYVCEGNVCRMLEPEGGMNAVLVSSEPLSTDKGWETVPVNHIVLIAKDLSVQIRKMNIEC